MLGPEQQINEALLPSSLAFATPLIAAIESSTKPIATFPNDFNDEFLFIFAEGHNYYLSKTREFLKYVDPKTDTATRIYDLDEVMQNLQPLLRGNTSGLTLPGQGH